MVTNVYVISYLCDRSDVSVNGDSSYNSDISECIDICDQNIFFFTNILFSPNKFTHK